MPVTYRDGVGWSAVCAVPDGFCHVYSVTGSVIAEGRWQIAVPTDHLRYLDAASSPDGQVQAIGVGGDDVAYWLHDGICERLGPAPGPYAVGILVLNGEFRRYVKRSSEAYEVNGNRIALPARLRGEAYGFQSIHPDGEPAWWIDRLKAAPGTNLQNWVEQRGLIAGIVSGPERVDIRVNGQQSTAIPGVAHSIRLASNSSAWAIAAATNHGAALIVVPPFPVVITPPDVTPPDPEPLPNPGPIEPNPGTPMLTKNYSALVRDQWAAQNMDARQIAAFKAGGKPAIQLLQGHFTRSIARMARGGQGDTGVWMEFYHNPIPGTDARIEPAVLLIDDGGQTWSAKIIRGYDQGGRFAPEGVKNPDGSDVERWTFGEVDWNVSDVMPNPADRRDPFAVELPPLTWETQQPAPTPDPTPDPEPAPANLEQRVRELESDVAALTTALEAQMEELRRIYAVLKTIDLDGVIRKGHPVNVEGSISVPFFGALPITAKGKL